MKMTSQEGDYHNDQLNDLIRCLPANTGNHQCKKCGSSFDRYCECVKKTPLCEDELKLIKIKYGNAKFGQPKKFDEDTKALMICGVCEQKMIAPLKQECGHTHCARCLTRIVESNNYPLNVFDYDGEGDLKFDCPECGYECSHRNLINDDDYISDVKAMALDPSDRSPLKMKLKRHLDYNGESSRIHWNRPYRDYSIIPRSSTWICVMYFDGKKYTGYSSKHSRSLDAAAALCIRHEHLDIKHDFDWEETERIYVVRMGIRVDNQWILPDIRPFSNVENAVVKKKEEIMVEEETDTVVNGPIVIPPPATNYPDFLLHFNQLKRDPEASGKYFLTLDPSSLSPIFSNLIEIDHVTVILDGLTRAANKDMADLSLISSLLHSVSLLPRFDIVVLFMKDEDRAKALSLIDILPSTVDTAEIRKNFE